MNRCIIENACMNDDCVYVSPQMRFIKREKSSHDNMRVVLSFH